MLNHPKKMFFTVPKSPRYALQLFRNEHNNAPKGNIDNRIRRLLVEPLHAWVLWLPHFYSHVFFIVMGHNSAMESITTLSSSWNKFASTHFSFFMCWNIEDNTLGMLPRGFDGRWEKEGLGVVVREDLVTRHSLKGPLKWGNLLKYFEIHTLDVWSIDFVVRILARTHHVK